MTSIHVRAPFRAFLGAVMLVSTCTGLVAQLPPPSPNPAAIAKLDPLLQRQLSDLSGQSYVIVRAYDATTAATAATLIQLLGGTLGRPLPILSGHAARVPNAAMLTLAENAAIQRISLDRLTFGFMERTSPTIGVTAIRQELGYDGVGIGVAVIDSGVAEWHDDLENRTAPGTQRVDAFVDFVGGLPTQYDDYGHGTHVAGIIAGNGADSGGARAGIAPAARLVVLKVLDAMGRGRISDVIAAIDYAVSHKNRFNIRVMNLSIGAGVYESYNTDPLTIAARRAVEHGIVVVAAAGNHGKNAQGVTQHGAISAPGNAPWVLTVGASSHMGTVDRRDDTIAAFSSRGPTAYDFAAKPDLVAPGVGIYSLSSPNSTMYSSRSQYLLSGTVERPYLPYLSLSGTSQAAPVVAGTVALMLQANPTLTPNAVKAILQYTAQAYEGHSALAQGAGFLNARGAVDLARTWNLTPEQRGPYPAEWSRNLVWGNLRVVNEALIASASAWNTNVPWGSSAIAWSSATAVNVVWGTTCNGADCQGMVWATTDDDTVVWGNSDEADTVVWGNTDNDTVVWGNSDSDTVVWGNTADESTCQPVIWP
jgi:serine protease AprX